MFQVIYGRWLIDGYPKVVLFDIGSAASKLVEWRKQLFEQCKIGIPWEDTEANNCLIFGFLTCWFISEVTRLLSTLRPNVTKDIQIQKILQLLTYGAHVT